VADVDDNDPVFSSPVYTFDVTHDTPSGVIIGQVTVTDDDIGTNADVTVTITSGNGARCFVIDGVTLKTAKTVSYTEAKEFTLKLKAVGISGLAYVSKQIIYYNHFKSSYELSNATIHFVYRLNDRKLLNTYPFLTTTLVKC
jgi:hypothetical protein